MDMGIITVRRGIIRGKRELRVCRGVLYGEESGEGELRLTYRVGVDLSVVRWRGKE